MKKSKHIGWIGMAVISCAAVSLIGWAGTGGKDMEAESPKAVNYKADDYDAWNKLLEENRISDSFKEALSQFAFQSGSKVLGTEDSNANYSPLSLYYAMAIAGCGAEGETARQITDSLGVSDQSRLAEECRKLYQWITYYGQRQKTEYEQYGEGEYDSSMRLGNSLWVSDQMKLKEDYQKLVASQFFAGSYQVDFTGQEAKEKIAGWISEQTNGVLKPSLNLESDTMLAIVNTLYFYGGWRTPFSEMRTADDRFTKADGSAVTVPFMNRVDTMGRFRRGDGYTVSSLHTNNDCSMVFVLPDQGRSVEEFLKTPEALEAVLAGTQEQWQSGEVTWKVPKFSFGSSMKLVELLKSMGVKNMFLPEQAEFGKISDMPLYVSDVIQETHIGIDENGVEGAAYTMMAIAAGSAMIEEEQKADMILDRPFLYGIQDDRTGAWLFMGVCRNPAEGQ